VPSVPGVWMWLVLWHLPYEAHATPWADRPRVSRAEAGHRAPVRRIGCETRSDAILEKSSARRTEEGLRDILRELVFGETCVPSLLFPSS
jgi:hypothetical protein